MMVYATRYLGSLPRYTLGLRGLKGSCRYILDLDHRIALEHNVQDPVSRIAIIRHLPDVK